MTPVVAEVAATKFVVPASHGVSSIPRLVPTSRVEPIPQVADSGCDGRHIICGHPARRRHASRL